MLRDLDDAIRELGPLGFDAATQEEFARRAAIASDNAVAGAITPLPPGGVAALPALGTAERRRLGDIGCEHIARGQVGIVVLAGGMATRFGGVVKAVVEAYRDPSGAPVSFLDGKCRDVSALGAELGARIPILVMSSFATHDAISRQIVERGLAAGDDRAIDVFPQMVALRLRPDGSLFRDRDGGLSPYATGHGDLTFALRRSGALARFRAAGGTTLLMTNVDNLGATLDPAIIGFHAARGGAITVEVVGKYPGDRGGAPASVDGVPQIIEGFRFPPAFDQDTIDVFNTNSLVFDAAAIDRDFPLRYYRVEKQVDGAFVIQFERLCGELTALLPSRFVRVDRTGLDARFLPAKDPEELAIHRAAIAAIAGVARWRLDSAAAPLG